ATLATKTEAEAKAAQTIAAAELTKAEAEAAGRIAQIAAENSMSAGIIGMRLEERRLDRMPEIMTQMMKPVEKIESIKINQITGLGGNSSGGGEHGAEGAFGSAMDQILGMAVRLPAMKQMGEEIGLDFDANLAGRTADYANRIKDKK
ncbi:MAG: flotillin domain-containing protein, partial [Sneathiella sp.]